MRASSARASASSVVARKPFRARPPPGCGPGARAHTRGRGHLRRPGRQCQQPGRPAPRPPVARHEPEPELHPQRPRAVRCDRHRPLEQRRGGVEAPRGLGARGGREQHALEQVARLGGVTRVEPLGVAHVLGRQRHLGVEPRDEPRRRRQVGGRRRIARGRLGHERRGRSGGRVLAEGDRLGQRDRAGWRRRVAGRALAGRTHRGGFATRLAQVCRTAAPIRARARPSAGSRLRQAGAGAGVGGSVRSGRSRTERAFATITPQAGHSGVVTSRVPQRGQSMCRRP
jgi:hypothetical protein